MTRLFACVFAALALCVGATRIGAGVLPSRGERNIFCAQLHGDVAYAKPVQLTISEASPPEEGAPLASYVIRLQGAENAGPLFEKDLGRGARCHILTYQGSSDRPTGVQAGEGLLCIWIEGQRSSAYAFAVGTTNLRTLFEKTEGRGTFSCRDIDCDGVVEILEEDSAWHIKSYSLTRRMLERLGKAERGRMIYRLRGNAFSLTDVQPAEGR